MGVLDKLTGGTKTPPHPTGYETVGGQPGAAVGGHIGEDARTVQSSQQHRAAQEAVPLTPTAVPQLPEVQTVAVANDDWHAETLFGLLPGSVTEIVGRDPSRETMDITNQSSANNGGVVVAVMLARTRADADRLAVSWPQGRGELLPDGAGRTHTHNANVFAVVDPAATANATLDVHIEQKRKPRP